MSWPRNLPTRFRRGERPSLKDYIDRSPEMAEEILELFPALVEVEQAKEVLDVSAGRVPSFQMPALSRSATTGHPRDRPGRHGRGLRGRADLAGPPRGAEGPAGPVARDPKSLERFRRRPAPRRGCTTPTSCRSSRSARTAMSTTTPCSSSRARGSTRSSRSCHG